MAARWTRPTKTNEAARHGWNEMSETMTQTAIDKLVHQVAQIGEVDMAHVARAAREVAGIDAGYRSQYVGFNDGHWHSAVLVNPSGRQNDHLISDGTGRPTELAAYLPGAMEIIDDLAARYGLNVCWARLALMDSGARVWEHRDFLELEQQDKVRLHVPLVTNGRATLHFAEGSVHMAPGFVWHLATDIAHGASNEGPDRVHLIIDCDDAAGFLARVRQRRLDPSLVTFFPVLEDRSLDSIEARFRQKVAGGDVAAAERDVLSLFGSWNLQHRTTFGLLSQFFEALGDQEKAAYWRTEEKDKLCERVY